MAEPSLPQSELVDESLQDMLRRAALGKGAILCYPSGDTSTARQLPYQDLYAKAIYLSQTLRSLPGFHQGQLILLHFDEHWDTIIWFWATLLANALPVLSSPFSNVESHRQQHINALSSLFQFPMCLTSERLLHLFIGTHELFRLHTIESLSSEEHQSNTATRMPCSRGPGLALEEPSPLSHGRGGSQLAILMLTSGSTGNAKAVRVTHRQVAAAVSGKAAVRQPRPNGPLLNWIGLDHVASLIEIHIQALWLGVDQIHVNAADIVSSPNLFLDLLSRHRVCRTFAPNFFLGRLVATVRAEISATKEYLPWDLSSLQMVASGGEANEMSTCEAASALFQEYGARLNVLTPGFGMTETCAGAIFNLSCPDYDLDCHHDSASLGKCMNGIEMRISLDSGLASTNETGHLELRGDVVFDGYYRNPKATTEAFPLNDGWFRTGDQAYINSDGNLCLIGRSKDVININGVKIPIADVDSLLERALETRVARLVVFSSRSTHSEQITVGYAPASWPHAGREIAEIEEAVVRACIAAFSSRPLVFSLRESSRAVLPVSALGKISRAKMGSLFDAGIFNEDIILHRQKLDLYRKEMQENTPSYSATTEDEALLIKDFAETLGLSIEQIGPETAIFELGFTSMDLIRLKRHIDTRLSRAVPILILLKNPTARLLSAALALEHHSQDLPTIQTGQTEAVGHDPVVTFKPTGTKTPLWLVHPGVGEALVFIGLAHQLADDDRPVYALRASGFESGQARFASIAETVDVYVQAIRRRQAKGPYAIAGYSYGAMLAFEMAKRLQALGGTCADSHIRFLGSFNLPPHIKARMRQLSWNLCILHLSQFLGLISEDEVEQLERSGLADAPRNEALTQVLGASSADRMQELGLEEAALARWADVAYGLQSMATDYEPGGVVDCMDIFHAVPLKWAASSREEWVSGHLDKWRDFCRTEPRMHAVEGTHYTLIGPEHIVGFAAKLKGALAARGI